MQPCDLELLVTREIPLGKYKGRLIAGLPGCYLTWFARKGFPNDKIGRLLALMQEIDHNGLRHILAPLRGRPGWPMTTVWHLYLIECIDGSFYAGVTTDVERRYRQHVSGNGSRYTRSHPPVRLVASRAVGSRSDALKAEWAIKRLPRAEKLAALRAFPDIQMNKANHR